MNRLETLVMGVAASGTVLSTGTSVEQSLDTAVVNAEMEHVRFENSHVRAIEGVLKPGDKEKIHSHPAFVVYLIAGGKIRNNFADGRVVETELKTGEVLYREAQTHWVENIGTTTIHFLVVELKNPDLRLPAPCAVHAPRPISIHRLSSGPG
jgi:quercetin dioxygenase-like cupin family protein